MSRPSRLGLALAATVAASSLFVGGGIAAADPPAPGSSACDALVKEDAAVKTAQGKVDANANDTAAATELSTAKTAAVTKLCTGTASGATSSTSPSPSSPKSSETKRPPREQGGDRNGGDRNGDGRNDDEQDGPGDDKDCDDFMSQREAQAYYEGAKRPGDEDPSNLDRDDDGKACESLADVDGDASKLPAKIDSKTLINQTDDDDSEAKTSGSQVKDVPQGSVDTGSAQ